MGLVLGLVEQAITIYTVVIFIYIIMSWVPGARESQFGAFFAAICEPYLEQFRKIIPPLGMIDISPIVAILALRMAAIGLESIFGMFAGGTM
ncbi:MAG TPA: YggT family protein [Pseudogracilibacillus sp.]|nr:YggT family protein [Pseudogracilibacillus sp.]